MNFDLDAIVPPSTIGVIGTGPGLRYFERAARELGYTTSVLDPASPKRSIQKLAAACAAVTFLDCVPFDQLRALDGHPHLHPSRELAELCYDRIALKRRLVDAGVPVGAYMTIESDADIEAASSAKFSAILKQRFHGSGRAGQVRCASHAELAPAWHTLGRTSCVLEQRLMPTRELSVIVARTAKGVARAFPVAQQQYVHGTLDISYAPANLPGDGHDDAAELCTYIAEQINLVGVLVVHMLVVGRDVFVHELVPRPNELGLFTVDGCRTDQYEQQLRAVCGIALGDTAMAVEGIAVINLFDEEVRDLNWQQLLGEPETHLHKYDHADRIDGPIGHLAVTRGSAVGSTTVARRLRKRMSGSS